MGGRVRLGLGLLAGLTPGGRSERLITISTEP